VHILKTRQQTYRIGINGENVLVESRIYANNVPHLVVDLQLERRHGRIKMNAVQVVHEEDLTVTLAPVSRLRALGRLADLHDHHVPAEEFLEQHRWMRDRY
jgi:hypothetical protein